ncbi:MAG: T9SS type A sorting domain-containing protein [Saprospiraceae bacterium]
MIFKYLILFSTLQFPLLSFGQCDRASDSLALISLYNATNGSDWFNVWNLDQPMSSWHGIMLTIEGCVQCIDLDGVTDCDGNINNTGNNLIGQIPDSIGNLSMVESISFGNNFLTGPIPSSFGQLQKLQILILRSNSLTGSIPLELGNLHDLDILNLSYNNISGEIPVEIGLLNKLNYLFLFDNDLSGPIPSTFSGLSGLFAFGAAGNRLTGEIPAFLGEMQLHRIDLHDNEFIGCFPEELRSLCDDDVNFSGNIALPWQGDFDQFCSSTTQIGAPCEDGFPYTINSINANCDCIGTFTSLSETAETIIKIYPNPAIHDLQIGDENNNDKLYCTISSMEGHHINTFETNHFDVSNLSSGIYLLEIQNKKSGKRNIIRFIKQ